MSVCCQVVALGTDGLQLYLRDRVSAAELTGHTWRPLTVPLPEPPPTSRPGSPASLQPEPPSAPAGPGEPQAAGRDWPGGAGPAGDTRSTSEDTAGSQRDSDSSSGGHIHAVAQ